MNKSRIEELAKKYTETSLKYRRYLHQNPELSFKEYKTSGFISNILKEIGIPHKTGYAGTGILGKLEGKNPGKKVIALRADMDALPILEENHVPYASGNKGIMHACGHDVHMASLLGVSAVLNELKDEFEGTVLFIFQPGEEKLPGGANLMMQEGIFDEIAPDIIIGQHVYPELDSGKVGFKPGIYMASTDELYLTVKGKGGHAALPDTLIDPVLIASHIVIALQQTVSRNANPAIPTVLSLGKFIANGATNVIPDKVEIEGTFRTLDEEWRAKAHKIISKTVTSVAAGMGGSCKLEIRKGYPVLINDPVVTQRAQNAAKDLLGDPNVIDLDIRMTAEDFAYFTQRYPAVFYRLGTRNKAKNVVSSLHTSTFNIDEDAMLVSIKTMSWTVISMLMDA